MRTELTYAGAAIASAASPYGRSVSSSCDLAVFAIVAIRAPSGVLVTLC